MLAYHNRIGQGGGVGPIMRPMHGLQAGSRVALFALLNSARDDYPAHVRRNGRTPERSVTGTGFNRGDGRWRQAIIGQAERDFVPPIKYQSGCCLHVDTQNCQVGDDCILLAFAEQS